MIDITKDKYTKEDLINLYESGMKTKHIAKYYNVSDDTIKKRLEIYGINPDDYNPIKIFYKSITKEKLIEYLKEGLSYEAIGKLYNVSNKIVGPLALKYGIIYKDYSEYRVDYNVHVFDEIDTEAKAYWLGFWFADGHVRSNSSSEIDLHLAAVDIGHLRKFKDFMEDTRGDEIIKQRERLTPCGNPQQMISYQLCNPNLKQALIRLGCVPKKSLILVFPDLSIFKDPDLVYDFIRGYNDGDGCLYATQRGKNKRLAISIRGTKEFLEGIRSFFPDEFTKVYSEVDKRTGNTQHKICCCSDKADRVAKKLYGDATVYLDRKYEKYTELCRNT